LTALTVTGNVTGGNINTAGAVVVSGSGAATSTTTGSIRTAGGIGVVGNAYVGGLINATGNISGDFFIGNGSQLTGIDATAIQNGTANVRTFFNGNVTVSASGTANVLVVTSTGANIAGTIEATGNAVLGNVATDSVTTASSILNKYATVTTSSVSEVALDQWSTSVFRSAKYYVQITSGTSYQVIELSMLHDASNVFLTQYGSITSNVVLGNFDASINSGNVEVLFTPTNATTTVRASAMLIVV
jgi:hypothetical protein